MPCPQFGITESAADGIVSFIITPGSRQGQSSSPVRISVGRVSARIWSVSSHSDGRCALHAELRVDRAERRMLGQLCLELGEAARVLVLELHARRAVGVALGEGLHPRLAENRDDVRHLLAEALALGRVRAVAAAGDHQRARPRGVAEAEMQGREPAHREAHDMRLSIPSRVEDGAMSSAARACEYIATSSGTSDGG